LFIALQFYGRVPQTEKIHGANNETAYYLDGATQVPISNPSTLDAGTYTFGSTIAKNPDSLSSDYTKSIRITPNTVEVVLRPDNVLYWYGYIGGDFEECNSTNGWSYNKTLVTPTYNDYNISLSAGNNACGVSTKTAMSGSFVAILTGTTASSGVYGYWNGETSKSMQEAGFFS
jgi:hypothetical protein